MLRHWSLAAVLAALASSGAAFADAPKAPDPIKPSLGADKTPPTIHFVVFRLKKDAPTAPVKKVSVDSQAMRDTTPSVRLLKARRPSPADQSTPKVAAHDYDIALLCMFDDAAGLKAYLEHQQHLDFVKKYEPY